VVVGRLRRFRDDGAAALSLSTMSESFLACRDRGSTAGASSASSSPASLRERLGALEVEAEAEEEDAVAVAVAMAMAVAVVAAAAAAPPVVRVLRCCRVVGCFALPLPLILVLDLGLGLAGLRIGDRDPTVALVEEDMLSEERRGPGAVRDVVEMVDSMEEAMVVVVLLSVEREDVGAAVPDVAEEVDDLIKDTVVVLVSVERAGSVGVGADAAVVDSKSNTDSVL